jgi:hypothetical protein
MQKIIIIGTGNPAGLAQALIKEFKEEYNKLPIVVREKALKEKVILDESENVEKNIKLIEFFGNRLIQNKVKCKTCNDILESIFEHHRVYCSCGLCSIDGGKEKRIRDCKGPYTELSTFLKDLQNG